MQTKLLVLCLFAQNYRDVFEAGECDDAIRRFVDELGWGEEYEKIIAEIDREHAKMNNSKEEV
mgnify:CR=1 FL=1